MESHELHDHYACQQEGPHKNVYHHAKVIFTKKQIDDDSQSCCDGAEYAVREKGDRENAWRNLWSGDL